MNADPLKSTREGHRLDPQDWDAFRAEFHSLLDACVDRMQAARDLPWQPAPADILDRVRIGGGGDVMTRMARDVMPFATGNTHPRFFGWVHGTGLPIAAAAELVAATMNSNMGGRDHGSVDVERAVIEWLRDLVGMPSTGFGILTTGTSQATILALSCARQRLFGDDVRARGVGAFPQVRVYIVAGGHACVGKALEVMGHGSDALVTISQDANGRMDMDLLADAVTRDRAQGLVPLAIVGTAGSVNTGTFDDFQALSNFCAAQDIWLHADAAFGLWTILADAPWKGLSTGIHRANSVATDFHKWIGVPYDCGACLIHDRDLQRRTFAARPEYLEGQAAGLAGGDLWFCDYGLELSRGFRALKVWAAVEALGVTALGAAITDNCRQAAMMGELVEASDVLTLACPVVSNLCCFRVRAGDVADIAANLQLSGDAVFSTTIIDGQTCLRAAIVNHRTTSDDVRLAIKAVEREVESIST